ncbi:hypothetical protein MRS44_011101 [Fusarium solani]|uniref:uncharacterized protein n=1 Tax=Fusarium solani TaxID=169388 RepID=UPI0023216C00|nr:hypothetical protein MRS44_011101 [Fusarium solani]KAJ4214916.1 hypothetical protein NW759_009938 [Fusarium solani]
MSRVSTPPQTPTQTTHAVLNGLTTPQSSPGSDVLPKPRVVENFRPISVIIIGAGFSGIYCGIRIPERLRNVKLTIYEKNSGIGGTWYENRYPGCACDIPSHSYQYTFAPNPNWSQSHAPGPEILQYLESVTKRYSVDRFIKTSHKVLDATWDEKTSQWHVTVKNLQTGETLEDRADVVISARGTLNERSWPDIPGLQDMKIPVMHSASWDESVNFENKRIGIIGGGSISPEQRKKFATDPEYYLNFRTAIERDGNSAHSLTMKDSQMQKLAREDLIALMRKKLESKPHIFESLLPDFGVTCRRLTPGPGYLEALTEDNVEFINTPIARATETGLVLQSSEEKKLDILVCATGFQTSAPPPFPVVGKNGQTMQQRFEPYAETYLSLATDGFPNYFMMLGPNAAIGTGPLTTMIERTGDYIVKCIRKLQKEGISSMEPKTARVRDFSRIIDEYFKGTVYLDRCSSWYKNKGGRGDRITGVWPGSALHAMETLRSPRWEDFDYVYSEDNAGKEGNRLAWLGDGWSAAQVDPGEGELAHFLQPELIDIPSEPFPEDTPVFRMLPFSH